MWKLLPLLWNTTSEVVKHVSVGSNLIFQSQPSLFEGELWRQFKFSSSAFNHSDHIWLEAELEFFQRAFLQHQQAAGEKVISSPTSSAGDYMQATVIINTLVPLGSTLHLSCTDHLPTFIAEVQAMRPLEDAAKGSHPLPHFKWFHLPPDSWVNHYKNHHCILFFTTAVCVSWRRRGEPPESSVRLHVMRLWDSEEGGGDAHKPPAHALFPWAANLLGEFWKQTSGWNPA